MGHWSDSTGPALCKDEANCVDLTKTATFVSTSSSNSQTGAYADKCSNGGMIGLARDGHIIVGPYNDDGYAWACDEHDVCNGAFVDGQYVYVSTETFPYVVGCWGPGPQQTKNVSCSTNSCPASSTSNSGKSSLTGDCASGTDTDQTNGETSNSNGDTSNSNGDTSPNTNGDTSSNTNGDTSSNTNGSGDTSGTNEVASGDAAADSGLKHALSLGSALVLTGALF